MSLATTTQTQIHVHVLFRVTAEERGSVCEDRDPVRFWWTELKPERNTTDLC